MPTPIPDEVPFDPARLRAGVELLGRSAARSLELGWTDDDGPRPGEWWCSAAYQGARVFVENQLGPVEAVEALLERLLDGGQCVMCGAAVIIPGRRYPDDRPTCEFRREGEHWLRGCDGGYGPPAQALNREQRRRQDRARAKRGR